jgi:hypothetical protein
MKRKGLVASLAVVLVVSLFTVGCESDSDSGSSDGGSLTGTWDWKSIKIDGLTIPSDAAGIQAVVTGGAIPTGGSTTIDMAFIQGLAGELGGQADGSVTVTLSADMSMSITYTLTATMPGEAPISESDTVTGTYSVSGNTLTVTMNVEGTEESVSIEYSVNGNTLTLNVTNAKILEAIDLAGDNGIDASDSVTPDQLAILESLSGEILFSRQ